jgi:putative ABC transport system permease protein
MSSPRWAKIFRDLWANRKRVVLSVLSIAVGVFAVGTVTHMYLISSVEMAKSYASVNPSDITVQTNDYFGDDLVNAIRRMPEVKAAEARSSTFLRFKVKDGDIWYPIALTAFPDYNNLHINKITPETYFDANPKNWPSPGVYPPPNREILLERSTLLAPNLGLGSSKQGDTIVVELPGGKQREMKLAGLVYDFSSSPATFQGVAIGFISMDTLDWLGQTKQYNQLDVITNIKPHTLSNISTFAGDLRDKLIKGGNDVSLLSPHEPGKHPMDSLFTPLSALLGILGLLSLPLSGFLVINTISALMTQQTRQIGVMKAVGGRTGQITGLYLIMVTIFGLLSLLVAMPLGYLTAKQFTMFMAGFANFKVDNFNIPPAVILLEISVAILVPLISSLYPVMKAARMTIRQAISDYGLGSMDKPGLFDRLIERIRGLPRPMMLSLRNTFRRKARLALTLATLIMASALFIAVTSVWASMNLTIDEVFNFFGFDSEVILKYPYRMDRISSAAFAVKGVKEIEGWGTVTGLIKHTDGTEAQVSFLAPPADSKVLNPSIISGRWLLPKDLNALVVTPGFFQQEKNLKVGDDVIIKINGKDTKWRIVGNVKMLGGGTPTVFANYPYFSRLVDDVDKAWILVVTTIQHDKETQQSITQAISDYFNRVGIQVSSTITIAQIRESNNSLVTILVTLIMSMAILIALVGGLGLMGLMSINVLERTREIGVMRAVGASNVAILQIFISEGLLIGLMSWLFGVIISIPLSRFLSDLIGMGLIQSPLTFRYSFIGALGWLLIVLLIAGLATYFPARDAARLTVRDVLAYE